MLLREPKDIYELLGFLEEPDSKLPDRYRSPFVFRGLSNESYTLKNSFLRMEIDSGFEYHLLRNFRKYSASNNVGHSDPLLWNLMSMAQHHGLPTRLLDWTFSPLIALHFATCSTEQFDREYDKNGVLWCVDFGKVNEYLPLPFKHQNNWVGSTVFSTRMLDNIMREYTVEHDNNISIKRQLKVISHLKGMKYDNQVNTYKKKLKYGVDNLSDEERLVYHNIRQDAKDDDKDYALFFEPPSIDGRIVNQYALFSGSSRFRGVATTCSIR